MLIGCAIDEGLSFERSWTRRWDELNARVRWLGPRRRLRTAKQVLGFALEDLVAPELARRGQPAVRLGERRGRDRAYSLEACLDALREAERVAPPGLLSWTTIAETLNCRPDLPRPAQMMFVFSCYGLPKWQAMRAALGHEEAVVSGRVMPRTREEWIILMAAAIDDGLAPSGRGWRARWAELRERHPRYIACQVVERGAARLGGGIDALYGAALARRAASTSHDHTIAP